MKESALFNFKGGFGKVAKSYFTPFCREFNVFMNEDAAELRIEITVNREKFPWDRKTITGLEVLDLAHETADAFLVYLKRPGEDELVPPDRKVDVENTDNRGFRTVSKHINEG